MNSCFVKVLLTAAAAAAVATAAITCSPAYAQSDLDSMRAQYSHGSSQRGGQSGSSSSMNPLLGSPPDYEADYLSGDDAVGSSRNQASARGGRARKAKAPQSARMTSLYGAPQDYEDSYSAHFGSQPGKMNGARQTTSFGLAAVEGLSSSGSGGGGGKSVGRTTLQRNSNGGQAGQLGGGNVFGSSIAASGARLATRLDSVAGGNVAARLYRSPW